MPFAMDLYVQSVVVQGKIYVGGGLHDHNHRNNYTVMEYDISSRQWSQLPQYYETGGFAMVAIKNQLVLVGGSEPRGRIRSLGVWNGRWTHPYSEMRAPRTRCSAAAYKEWLVVAGGLSNSRPSTVESSVEVLDTGSNTWHTLSPLPTAFVDMKTAIVGETCYFMGGCIADSRNAHPSGLVATDRVFSVHLPTLLSQVSPGARRENVWSEMMGYIRSTPLSLGESLLAVGGREGRNQAIHRYHGGGRWEEVGDLSTPRFNCACALIGGKELVIVGGYDGVEKMKRMDSALIN